MAVSSTNGRGNIPADEGFLEWMEENSRLEVIDPAEFDLPFAAKKRFAGAKDEPGSPWMVPPKGARCAARAYVRDADGDYIVDENDERLQRPCYNWPMRGAKVCLHHGGGVIRVKKKAIERLASSLDAVTGALIKIALDENVNPKDRITAINSVMDRVGVRGGVEVDIQDPGYLDVLKDLFKPGAVQTDEEEEEPEEVPEPVAKARPKKPARARNRKRAASEE